MKEPWPQAKLDEIFGGSYGIYAGKPSQRALLRFSAASALWVADEEWHPMQVGHLEPDGQYILEVPYTDPTELTMDILRHGHHIEVLGPENLRLAVSAELGMALGRY